MIQKDFSKLISESIVVYFNQKIEDESASFDFENDLQFLEDQLHEVNYKKAQSFDSENMIVSLKNIIIQFDKEYSVLMETMDVKNSNPLENRVNQSVSVFKNKLASAIEMSLTTNDILLERRKVLKRNDTEESLILDSSKDYSSSNSSSIKSPKMGDDEIKRLRKCLRSFRNSPRNLEKSCFDDSYGIDESPNVFVPDEKEI